MAYSNPEESSWTFTDFVVYQSQQFPHLNPLKEFLTGVNQNPKWEFKWTRSDKVDVIILDINAASSRCTSYHLQDSQSLKTFLAKEIPDQVAVRLFLVEDMTPIVTEILGSAMELNPELFLSHMYHYGKKSSRLLNTYVSFDLPFLGRAVSASVKRQRDYFSFPHRKSFLYRTRDDQEEYEKTRTMFRGYNNKESTIEQRISGSLNTIDGSTKTIGIILFDSAGKSYCSTIPQPQGFDTVPHFSTSKETAAIDSDHLSHWTARGAFLQRFESPQFVQSVLENANIILYAILRNLCNEWLEQVSSMEEVTRDEYSQRDFVNHVSDHAMETGLKRVKYLQESVDMMKTCVESIQHPERLLASVRRRQPDSDQKVDQILSELDLDFQELLRSTEEHVKRLLSSYSMNASVLAIHESRKAIKQAENIGALTSLATFYIPLSFVTSFLGMNVTQLSSQNQLSMWVFFAIAIPLLCLSFVVVGNWAGAVHTWRYFFGTSPGPYPISRKARWKRLLRIMVGYLANPMRR